MTIVEVVEHLTERKLEAHEPERSAARDFFVDATTKMRERSMVYFFVVFSVLTAFTITVVFLQGFRVGGFSLEPAFLHWLGAATVGEVASLGTIIYKSLFK